MARYLDPTFRPGANNQGPMPSDDPLGLAAMAQAREQDFTNRATQIGEDYSSGTPGVDAAAHNTGPLPNLGWEGLLQALHDSGGKVIGGQSAPGSNQITGLHARMTAPAPPPVSQDDWEASIPGLTDRLAELSRPKSKPVPSV